MLNKQFLLLSRLFVGYEPRNECDMINIIPVVIFLVIFGGHMNILFNFKGENIKILL